MTKRRLGELLRAEGLINDDQLRAALEEQKKSNLFFGEALVKLGYVSEEVIAATIVQQFNLPFISAGQCNITSDVLNLFPERMYYEYQFVAIDKIGRTLIIVGAGLMNHDVLDELERLTHCKVCQYVSTWKDIKATLERHAKDMKKGQENLNELGNMLLESGIQPMPKKIVAAAPVAPVASPLNLVQPKQTNVLPAAAAAAISGQRVAIAAANGNPPPPPPPPANVQAPAASARGLTGVAAPRQAAPQPPPQSPKVGTLAGVKPPARSSGPALTAVPGGAPAAKPAPVPAKPAATPAPAAAPASGTGAAVDPAGKSGLLGLFKKT